MDRLLSVRCLGDIPSLLQRYANGELTPSRMVEVVHALVQNDADYVWIHTLPLATLKAYARAVAAEASANGMEALPLVWYPLRHQGQY